MPLLILLIVIGAVLYWMHYNKQHKAYQDYQNEKAREHLQRSHQATLEKIHQDEIKELDEQLTLASDQIKDEVLSTRLKGFYVFENILEKLPTKLYWQAIDILNAHLQTELEKHTPKDPYPEDIQLGLNILLQRKKGYQQSKSGQRRSLVFKNIDFSHLVFQHANFRGAHLENVTFHQAQLRQGDFFAACLINTRFDKAELSKANFTGAQLTGVSLAKCKLDEADFITAELENTTFSEAQFKSTRFRGARFQKVNFSGVDMDTSGITKDHLKAVIIDEHTRLPQDLRHKTQQVLKQSRSEASS